jgi:hypothetical protein
MHLAHGLRSATCWQPHLLLSFLVLAAPLILTGGCGGDQPGYELIVDNQSGRDVIVMLSGTAMADAAPGVRGVDPVFVARAGTEPGATGWVDAPWAETKWRPQITVYSDDCVLLGDLEVAPGTHTLLVRQGGELTIEAYAGADRLPPGVPRLPAAGHGCR